ncbi:MAG: phosphoenolpyruvate carboxylase [Paraglaciecola sp.]|jgi:phosphoenolpyruvate carboxylase
MLICKYIRRLDQAKLNNLAKQVSKDYQYNKSHPEIIAATKKILSHDEQLQKSIEREVDCKTMTGKILNILSGLGHGTGIGNGPVKCGKYSGLKSFIKKR